MKRLTTYGPIWYEPLVLAHWRQHDGQATGALARAGRDLADRQVSVEATLHLVPEHRRDDVLRAALGDALRHSLVTIRRQLDVDDLPAALAQARALVTALERRTDTAPAAAAVSPADDLARAHRRIEQLEAQLRAWMALAVRARTALTDETITRREEPACTATP